MKRGHREASHLHVGQLSVNDEVIATVHYIFLDPHDPPITGEFTVVEGAPELETANIYQLHLEGGGRIDVEVTGVITRHRPNQGGEQVLMYLMDRCTPFPSTKAE